jgi:hypothetical protein
MEVKGLSFVVRAEKPVQTQQQSSGQDPPFDVGAFLWGLLVGAIATVAVEAVTIYYTWPILVGFVKTAGLSEVMKEALG